MRVNTIFDDVKVYDVQDRLDVVQGQKFAIEIVDGPEGLETFTSKDPVLTLVDDTKVTASELGESKIRFMDGVTVVKDLIIVVVAATFPNATVLGLTLGEPVQK